MARIRNSDTTGLDAYNAKVTALQGLTEAQERKYVEWRDSDDPKLQQRGIDRLVESTAAYVVAMAKRFSNQGVSIDDLVGAGNIGLVRAARLFDPDKGARFKSYAHFWIVSSFQRYFAQQHTAFRRPINKSSMVPKIGGAMQMGMTKDEICEDLDISPALYDELNILIQPLTVIDEVTERSLAASDVTDEYVHEDAVERCLDRMPESARDVVRLRMQGYTFNEISDKLGIGYRDAINRIQAVRFKMSESHTRFLLSDERGR